MRIFQLSLGIAAMAASIATPSSAAAQRNSRRSALRPRGTESSTVPVSPVSPVSPASPAGDYSLAVVSALLPSVTLGGTSDVVTLVIENRGTASAPASVISVAPRNYLSLARQSSIPELAPGQRATVQLPVVIGPDGTPCISITINTPPIADPAVARFLAASMPDPMIDSGGALDWEKTNSWDYFSPFGEIGFSGDLGAQGDL